MNHEPNANQINMFINNNNHNYNTFPFSLEKSDNNMFEQNSNINQSQSKMSDNSSCSKNIKNLFDLENKNNDLLKSIAIQNSLIKNNQQNHINIMCESLKTEMNTLNLYNKSQMQIDIYINSMQNILNNQIQQINQMNTNLEELKNMINQQAKMANLIDELKESS